MTTIKEILGAQGMAVAAKLGLPNVILSQLEYEDVQLIGDELKNWRINVKKVWANTASFTMAIDLWANISAEGEVVPQAQAEQVPSASGGTKARTCNLQSTVSISHDMLEAIEVEVLNTRASQVVDNPQLEFGKGGTPSLFFECKNPSSEDGVGFSLVHKKVWSKKSNAEVDIIEMGVFSLSAGFRLRGNDLPGEVSAEPIRVFKPRLPASTPVIPPVIEDDTDF